MSPEQSEKQRQNYEQLLQAGRAVLEQEKKRIEEQRKIEEQKKQEAVKARRERSADAAAHAGAVTTVWCALADDFRTALLVTELNC